MILQCQSFVLCCKGSLMQFLFYSFYTAFNPQFITSMLFKNYFNTLCYSLHDVLLYHLIIKLNFINILLEKFKIRFTFGHVRIQIQLPWLELTLLPRFWSLARFIFSFYLISTRQILSITVKAIVGE